MVKNGIYLCTYIVWLIIQKCSAVSLDTHTFYIPRLRLCSPYSETSPSSVGSFQIQYDIITSLLLIFITFAYSHYLLRMFSYILSYSTFITKWNPSFQDVHSVNLKQGVKIFIIICCPSSILIVNSIATFIRRNNFYSFSHNKKLTNFAPGVGVGPTTVSLHVIHRFPDGVDYIFIRLLRVRMQGASTDEHRPTPCG